MEARGEAAEAGCRSVSHEVAGGGRRCTAARAAAARVTGRPAVTRCRVRWWRRSGARAHGGSVSSAAGGRVRSDGGQRRPGSRWRPAVARCRMRWRRRSGARAHGGSVLSAAGGRARGDGAWRLGRRRQGSWRRASAASSPAEVDDRSGDGKGRGVGPQLLVHQPRWMIGATSVAEACSVRFFGAKAAVTYQLRALYLWDSCSTRDCPIHFTVSRYGQFFPSLL
jgi:hypothetical protein